MTRIGRGAAARVTLVLLLSLAGCGAYRSAPAAAGAFGGQVGLGALAGGWGGDVCGLLSTDEIRATTGLDVEVGQDSAPGQRDCVWYSDRGAVTVTSLGGADAFEGPRAHAVGSGVQGVGDAAYWVPATCQLVVRAGAVVLAVNVDIADIRASYADARELASLMLPHL